MGKLPKPKFVLFDIDETLIECHQYRLTMFKLMSELGIEDVTELNNIFLGEDLDDKYEVFFDPLMTNGTESYGKKAAEFIKKSGITEEQLTALHTKYGLEKDPKNPPFSQALYEKAKQELDGFVEIDGAASFIHKLREDGVAVGFITSAVRNYAERALNPTPQEMPEGLEARAGFIKEGDLFHAREEIQLSLKELNNQRKLEGKTALDSKKFAKAGSIAEAIKQAGVEDTPDLVWYVGDSQYDIRSPLVVGAISIAFGPSAEYFKEMTTHEINEGDFECLTTQEIQVAKGFKTLEAIYSKCQSAEKAASL